MNYFIKAIDILENKKERNQFIHVPFDLYKGEKNWVPQLKLSQIELLNKKHPFFLTSKVKAWLLINDKSKIVGRIMAVINQSSMEFHEDKCGFFGFLDCVNDKNAFELLLNTAKSYIKSFGLDEIRGPVQPSTNYECGVMVKGYDEPPQIMMPYNFSYYDERLNELQYKKAMDLLSYRVDAHFTMPEVFKKISARVEKSERITYRKVNLKDWDNEVKNLLDIYNSAWEKNWGFIPMSKEEFIHLANDLKMVIDDRLVLFAEVAGKPAGFIIALPDFNQIFKKIPNGKLLPTGIFKLLTGKKKIDRVRVLTMGFKSEYRKLGLASLLYYKCHEEIKKIKQYKEIEMSWILESNFEMNKPLIRMGADVYKKHRIYSQSL